MIDDDEIRKMSEETVTTSGNNFGATVEVQLLPKKRNAYKSMYEEARDNGNWYRVRFLTACVVALIGWAGCITFLILWL